MSITVVCALIIRENAVLCAQRSAAMALPLKWEFPGGKLEDGEDPVTALKREILEELGVDIEVGNSLSISVHTYDGGPTIKLLPFLSFLSNNGEPQAHEHAEIRWVKPEQLLDMDWAAADIPIVIEYLGFK